MDLSDATPRWVSIQFESSPSDDPGRLDGVYTRRFTAWLEPDGAGLLVVRVDGEVLEQTAFRGRNPVPGSFSDYVWVFDPTTGSVLSASFNGRVLHEVSMGFGSTWIEAEVAASMSTQREGGYYGPTRVWGNSLHRYCEAHQRRACTQVAPRGYDRTRGYVNAVGPLQISASLVSFETFSALGEARFSELRAGGPGITDVPAAAARSQITGLAKTQVSAVADVSAPPPGL